MSQNSAPKENLLAREKSPYLLQHASNPVDWHPWGPETLARAQKEDKPLLVSIGYATCHWCHVMERESFSDPELARYLNAHFVPIKVDREERPDVDRFFMDALLALGQSGGWPLNMFATPQGEPITGGTYFPPHDAHGRRSFLAVLQTIGQAWQDNRQQVLENAQLLTEHLRQHNTHRSGPLGDWDQQPEEHAFAQYLKAFDHQHGGFRFQEPQKFPPCMAMLLLLRYHRRCGASEALDMVTHTLRHMLSGGIYDHLGGGLCRYSTDRSWNTPHFEKMLYDNALLVQVLLETSQVSGRPYFRAYAEDVLTYALNDLRTAEGTFASAEDADSEGEEGRFYTWTTPELEAHLPPELATAARTYWGLDTGVQVDGRSILHCPRSLSVVAAELEISLPILQERLAEARERLLHLRTQRPRPLCDDKTLTSWNALMISALARAAIVCADSPHAEQYLQAATQAAEFIFTHLRNAEGRLLRRYRQGEARFAAYLVDHAQLGCACLDLYEVQGERRWFRRARWLAECIEKYFRQDEGPYLDVGRDAEQLTVASAKGDDAAEPSGNSATALLMLRLHAYGVRGSQDADYQANALRIFGSYRGLLAKASISFPAMLQALHFHLAPPLEIALVGDPQEQGTQRLLSVLRERYLPQLVLAQAAPHEVEAAAEDIPLLAERTLLNGKPTAYLCQNGVCQLPVTEPEALRSLIDSATSAGR